MLIKVSANIKPVFTDLQNRSHLVCVSWSDAMIYNTEVRLSDLCCTLHYFITVGGAAALWEM